MGKKEVRENFRNSVFKRDGYKCRLCGDKTSKLDAHHITNRKLMPNGGYVASNGITLCDNLEGCHRKVEAFYHRIDRDSDLENPLHPNNLYEMINSSYELAYKDSEKLK